MSSQGNFTHMAQNQKFVSESFTLCITNREKSEKGNTVTRTVILKSFEHILNATVLCV